MFIVNIYVNVKKGNKRSRHSLQLFVIAIASLCFLSACKKFVDVGAPVTSTNGSNIYNNNETAPGVLTGIYTKMSQAPLRDASLTGLSYYGGLSADELKMFDVNFFVDLAYYRNALASSESGGGEFWDNIYPLIFVLNSAVEGVEGSNDLLPAVKSQLLGEAKFMRAFCYFYLANLYGDVPLILSTDYKKNAVSSRTAVAEVYNQIVIDLVGAQSLLRDDYVEADAISTNASTARVRPNKMVAAALLSRVYLYMGEYGKAEAEATKVISKSAVYQLVPLTDVFKSTSTEAIWQLQPVNAGWNTEDARIFVLPPTGPSSFFPVYLSDILLDSFEPADQRKTQWIGSVTAAGITYSYPNKYQSATLDAPVTEYTTVFRLAEQYLIRAEARVQLGANQGATDDLKAVRMRSGLQAVGFVNKEQLLQAILHERQVELFTEWGHRWLDLKRTGNIDQIMTMVTPQKGGSWEATSKLFPLPARDLAANKNLVQNPGY